MTTRELTCVVCPAGCKITVTLNLLQSQHRQKCLGLRIINFYGKIGARGSEWAGKNTLIADGAQAPFI